MPDPEPRSQSPVPSVGETGPRAGESGAPDPRWLERVRARDPEALGEFYERYVDRVFGLAWRMLGERTLAEDATSDVFYKVHRAADRLDPTRDPVPWLVTITANVCRDRCP